MLITQHCRKILIFTVLMTMASATATAAKETPPNAADLYRKAFELYQPDGEISRTLIHLTDGKVELDQSIIKHVSANKKVIDIALEASKVENCDWEFNFLTHDPTDPNEAINESKQQSENYFAMRRIIFLILADAKIHAQESQVKEAVDKVFTAYAVSRHIYANSMLGYLVRIGLEIRIDNVLTDILSEQQLNGTMLNYIELKLKHHIKIRHALEEAFDSETKYGLNFISKATPEIVKEQAYTIFRMFDNDPNFIEFMDSANVKYSDLDRDYFLKHRQKLRKTMEMPYTKAIAAIMELNDVTVTDAMKFGQNGRDVSVNSTAFMMQLIASPSFWSKVHTLHVRTKTRFNALLTAIEIYKTKAKTGKLPIKIPTGLPKDLFSGKDFAYERTETGFTLRCQAKDLSKDKIHEYEFKTAK